VAVTRTVKVVWEGKEAEVVIKKLTWGELNDVMRQSIGKIRVIGSETPAVDFDVFTFREQLLLKSIVSAPFKVDIETIRSLDPDVADRLLAEALALNPFRPLF
jgi:hypothetical protein